MEHENTLVLRGAVGDLESIVGDFIMTRAHDAALGERKTWELLLALDEICSSLVVHNGFGDESRCITLRWKTDHDGVIITLIDNGAPFNPLKPAGDEAALEKERHELGGMDHDQLTRMVDEMGYERKDGCNCLTLRKFRHKRKG